MRTIVKQSCWNIAVGELQGNIAILRGTLGLEDLNGSLKIGCNAYILGGITYSGTLQSN